MELPSDLPHALTTLVGANSLFKRHRDALAALIEATLLPAIAQLEPEYQSPLKRCDPTLFTADDGRIWVRLTYAGLLRSLLEVAEFEQWMIAFTVWAWERGWGGVELVQRYMGVRAGETRDQFRVQQSTVVRTRMKKPPA